MTDQISYKDLKAFDEMVRPGAAHRLSDFLPGREEINRVRRDTTRTLSNALKEGSGLDEYEADQLVNFLVQKLVGHFEDGGK